MHNDQSILSTSETIARNRKTSWKSNRIQKSEKHWPIGYNKKCILIKIYKRLTLLQTANLDRFLEFVRRTDPEFVLGPDPEEVSLFGDHIFQFAFVNVGRKAGKALPFRLTGLALLEDVAGQWGSTAVIWLFPLYGGTRLPQLGDAQASGSQRLFCIPQSTFKWLRFDNIIPHYEQYYIALGPKILHISILMTLAFQH